VLDRGEARHVRANLGHHGQRRGHIHTVDARQVHAAHPEQLRALVELGRVARREDKAKGEVRAQSAALNCAHD
jgi:hypothetical protein